MLQTISNLLSAPVVPIYISIIFATREANFLLAAALGIIFLSLFSLLPIIYLYRKGKVDLDVSAREKRSLFYITAITGYIIASAIFKILNMHVMFCIAAAYVFVTATLAIINVHWKISAHAAGVAGPTTALVWVFGLQWIWLYFFTAIVIWARWKLKAHTAAQLFAGAISAILVTVVTYAAVY